jgi:hypothetical protein
MAVFWDVAQCSLVDIDLTMQRNLLSSGDRRQTFSLTLRRESLSGSRIVLSHAVMLVRTAYAY